MSAPKQFTTPAEAKAKVQAMFEDALLVETVAQIHAANGAHDLADRLRNGELGVLTFDIP